MTPASAAWQSRSAVLSISLPARSRLMKIIRPMTPLRQRMSRSREIRGRIADQANKVINHFYALGAHLSASNFPGAAYARRHANSQLLAPHHRRVSALRRPIRQAFPHLARSSRRRAYPHLTTPSPPPAGLEEHLYPDRLCPAFFLRDHPGPSVDGGLYPLSQKAQDAPRHPLARRG